MRRQVHTQLGAIFTLLSLMWAHPAFSLPGYSPGSASQKVEWHYTLRPQDNIHNLGTSFLKASLSSKDLIRYNDISDTTSLRPGSTLKVPVDWLKHEPIPAKAASVTGKVMIRRHLGAKYLALKTNSLLQIGDEVQTHDGSVLIRFADGSILRLGGNSSLVFNRLTRFGKTGMTDTRMRLQRGSLSTQVRPLNGEGSRYEINTPSAVAAVRGTAFRLKVVNDSTQLEVTEGLVQFSSDHISIPVGAGKASILRKQATRSNVLNIPPAPEPLALIDRTSELPIQLHWKEVPKADKYHYEIFNQDTAGKLIDSEVIEKPNLTIQHLENGTYTIAMRAKTREGIEGFSHLLQLQVRMQARPATPIYPVNNEKMVNDMPEFTWNFNGDNELAKIQVATDATFNHVIASSELSTDNTTLPDKVLAPGDYYWRVVTQTGGSSFAHSPARKLAIRGQMPTTRILNIHYDHNQVSLFWKPIPEVKKYQIQIALDQSFNDVVISQITNNNQVQLELSPGKQYFARVRALDNDFYLSKFGPERSIFIR